MFTSQIISVEEHKKKYVNSVKPLWKMILTNKLAIYSFQIVKFTLPHCTPIKKKNVILLSKSL